MMGQSSLVLDFEKSLKSDQNSARKSVRQFWGVGKSVPHILRFFPTSVKSENNVSNSVLSVLEVYQKGPNAPFVTRFRTLKNTI